MPINDDILRAFTWKNIKNAPQKPGVYALFDGAVLIYYGMATESIADRLASHKRGDEGSCTQNATSYKREVTDRPAARERELLQEYKNQYGQLPRCNDKMP